MREWRGSINLIETLIYELTFGSAHSPEPWVKYALDRASIRMAALA